MALQSNNRELEETLYERLMEASRRHDQARNERERLRRLVEEREAEVRRASEQQVDTLNRTIRRTIEPIYELGGVTPVSFATDGSVATAATTASATRITAEAVREMRDTISQWYQPSEFTLANDYAQEYTAQWNPFTYSNYGSVWKAPSVTDSKEFKEKKNEVVNELDNLLEEFLEELKENTTEDGDQFVELTYVIERLSKMQAEVTKKYEKI